MKDRKKLVLAALALLGVLALAVWTAQRQGGERPESDPVAMCDLFLVTGGDEEGTSMLTNFFTEEGVGIWNADYYASRREEGLVLRVRSGGIPEEGRHDLSPSGEGKEMDLKLRPDPESLDLMLDNPRYGVADVERVRAMSGTVRGRFFGPANIDAESPCWFMAI